MKTVYIIISILLVVFSLLVIVVGMTASQSAPQESVVVGSACFVGILARIAQAAGHNYGNKTRS